MKLSIDDCWDSTAPTPLSEASSSTTNWQAGSGWMRMGAEAKQFLRSLKATSASGDHRKGVEVEVRAVSGAAM